MVYLRLMIVENMEKPYMTRLLTLYKKVIIPAFIIILCTFALAGCKGSSAGADGVSTIKICVAMPRDDFRCDYVRQFASDVETGTQGRVKCDVHYQDEYGDQLLIYDDMKKGKVDVSIIAAPYFTDIVPEEGITGLPYLFTDHETAWKFSECDINREVDDKLEKRGFKVLSHYCGSFRNLSNSVRPINTPEDMKGLIIGTVKSKTLMDMFSVLGATSYSYVSSELYDNLNRRTFDGADWSATTFYTNEYYKIQNYVAVTNHAYNLWNMVMRTSVYNSLSEEDRAVIDAAAKVSAEGEHEAVHQNEEDIFKKLEELGLEVTYPDLKPFIEATEKIRENYSGDFKDVYAKTRQWLDNR